MKKKIAILGSNGHIAKGLISRFIKSDDYEIYMFCRSSEYVSEFLKTINGVRQNDHILSYDNFFDYDYNVIINCVGLGTPAKLKSSIRDIFSITEKYDDMALDYLEKCPSTLYVNISSGAIYGKGFNEAADLKTCLTIDINNITFDQYYSITKLNSEAKHRAHQDLRIVDLRVFSYFSRFIDLESDYFIAELVRCVRDGAVFKTNKQNILRDYIGPDEMFAAVSSCIKYDEINGSFDVFTIKPVSKYELLTYFSETYGVKSQFTDSIDVNLVTGSKVNYFSNCRKLSTLGYEPLRNSFSVVKDEMKKLIL